jgi:hypothetical protein
MKTGLTMILQRWPRMAAPAFAALVAGLASMAALAAAPQAPGKGKPTIAVRATPAIAFAPARIVATAELTGGADDFQDYYCPKVEWNWADLSTSEAADDCDPYAAGQTTIRRRYAAEHKYESAGTYEIRFSLKQGKKIVGSSTYTVRVKDGQVEVLPNKQQ